MKLKRKTFLYYNERRVIIAPRRVLAQTGIGAPAYREENFAVSIFENMARKGLPKVHWGVE